MLKYFEIKMAFRYYIKQIDSMLPCVWFRNRSQKTSKCGKNISDTLDYVSCATFLFLPDFETKAVKAKYKIWKRKQTKPLNTILIQFQLFIFYETRLFTEKFSRTTTIHPGIFGGRVLWADRVSRRMNTIASGDQLKPIRIGENLVVNYN